MCDNTGTILIVIIAVLILVIVFRKNLGGPGIGLEGFYTYPGYYKKYCPSCENLSSYGCTKCTNCISCVAPDGTKTCVAGDSTGPFYDNTCAIMEYGSPYDYYPFGNVFSNIKQFSQYPYNRWNITGWDYKKGYDKYERELKEQARNTRDLAYRLEHSKQ